MDLQIILYMTYLFLFIAVFLFGIAGYAAFRVGLKKYEEKYLSQTQQELDEMFLLFTPEQFLYINILIVFVLAILGYVLTSGNWVVTGIAGLMGLIMPRIVLKIMKRKRLEKFDEQLVDALSTMANSLKAGFSLVQTFELVSREMSPPLSQEFGLMLRENKLGVHLDKALQNMTTRLDSNNLDLVVTSCVIARQAGGNLAEVFETIAKTIREISMLEGKIDALTAQGRLQGLVLGVLPIVIAFAVNYLEPDLFSTMLEDPIGWGIIGLIVIFEAMGVYVIWRIVSIDI